MRRTLIIALPLAMLAGACANKNLSPKTLADTEAAMQSAQEIGAGSQPEASLHLRYAQDQLATAKRLLDDGDEKRARRMLDRAHADAELALALARTERDRAAAKTAWAEVDELRSKTPPATTETGPAIQPLDGAGTDSNTQETVR